MIRLPELFSISKVKKAAGRLGRCRQEGVANRAPLPSHACELLMGHEIHEMAYASTALVNMAGMAGEFSKQARSSEISAQDG